MSADNNLLVAKLQPVATAVLNVAYYTTTTVFVVLTSTVLLVRLELLPWLRISFSKGPLGIQNVNKLKPKKHSICSVEDAGSLKEFLKANATSYRSCHSTLYKQVPKAFRENNIVMRSIFSKQLSYKHFKIVFSHESRHYSFLPLAFLVSVMRFVVAQCMVGSVDEFYAVSPDTTETLLAWTSSIVWNRAYRAMWFYQSTEAARRKCYIWHASLRIAIERSLIMPNVKYIDLGPSISKSVVQAKEKYGFQYVDDWYDQCYKNDGRTNFVYDDTKFLPKIDIL